MTARPAPGELEWRAPDCPICGEETSHDGDSYYCEGCNACWPGNTGEGEWLDDTASQCPSTHQPLAKNEFAAGQSFRFDTVRCLLSADHKPPHRHDVITDWTDETAVNGYGPAVEVTP